METILKYGKRKVIAEMVKITNFRDIGGIKNRNGKEVLTNVFLRSGELSSLTEADARHLETTYRLSKIVDLRGEDEIQARPDKTVPQTKYIHIDIMKDVADEGAGLEDFVKIGSPEKATNYMTKIYEDIALNPTSQKGYARFFQEVLTLNQEESVLFHCFAGKDRTGIAALLLLESLDVPRKAIYVDYLRTNELRKKENAMILAQAKKVHLNEENLAALDVALNVDSSYLDRFYQVVEKEYGSIQTYLKQALAIDQSSLQAMNNQFLKG